MTTKSNPLQAESSTMGRIKSLDQSGYPLLIARLVLGIMFIQMGWSKVGDPVSFLKMLREYEMFPPGAFVLENMIALTLPWIEVLCGVLLIVGILVRGAALTLLLMLTGFTIVITIRAIGMFNSGEFESFCDVAFDCGCGGGLVGMCKKLPENFGLWLISWIPLLSASRRFCLAGALGNRPTPDAELNDSPPKVTIESTPN
ncbi:MAG: hypothetical protein DHS20C16_26710 [Phycisphaerae bacterium]|nr:MAG: hypothetical protein DHS20C16_26710 [Phycisphaerae bacterium]